MLNTSSATSESSTSEEGRETSRSTTARAVRVLLVSLLAVVTTTAVFAGLLAFGSGNEPDQVDVIEAAGESVHPGPGGRYLGTVAMQSGSTIDLTFSGVASASDVRVLEAPAGVAVDVTDGPESTRLLLSVEGSVESGIYSLVFDIDGEPEPVWWTFGVIDR